MEPDKSDPFQFHIPQQPPAQAKSSEDPAVAFARAKINSIFDQNKPSPTSPPLVDPDTEAASVYQPEKLYQAESHLQDEMEPEKHHYSPEYQLPAGYTAPPSSAFENLNIAPVPTSMQSSPTPSRQEMIASYTAEQTNNKKKRLGRHGHILRPMVKAALVSALVFLVYNAPIVMGQIYYYITPANSEPTPVILNEDTEAAVSGDPRIIISKLNIDAPVVYDEPSFDESKVQAALQRGILHYGTTALPGELGNAVYLGHSSNSPWDPGRYKTVFSILRRLEVNDTFVMHYQGKRYIYEVYAKKVTDPTDLSVLDQRVSEPIITLITCDPPGVNWRRLAIMARQISPDPTKAQPTKSDPNTIQKAGTLPGSPPSLYDRIHDWLF